MRKRTRLIKKTILKEEKRWIGEERRRKRMKRKGRKQDREERNNIAQNVYKSFINKM